MSEIFRTAYVYVRKCGSVMDCARIVEELDLKE